MVIPERAISIPVERYADLVRAELEAETLKDFLGAKLKNYGDVKYEELKTLRALGLIWEVKDNEHS